MDEATAQLDAEAEKDIKVAMERIIEQRSITVILIAHRLSTIKDADRIILIDKGGIMEMGKHEELLHQNGMYSKLIKRQIEN